MLYICEPNEVATVHAIFSHMLTYLYSTDPIKLEMLHASQSLTESSSFDILFLVL